MKYALYGDGVNDDTAAIQEMLDKGGLVALPEPEKFYLISATLKIHSDTELVLGRFTEVRLAAKSNAPM
ncbi:MAG: hypothetical protein IKD29_00685, partial [Lentisphaeria bacterium]|nr:hypothetical protein [Lentisphaeria bacterium]